MKTIFGLFEQVAQAQTAVDALLADGFTEEEMNAIALEPTVKENIDIDLHRVDVQKSPEHGGVTVQGLAYLFGGEQPVHVGGTGHLLAGGELATLMATRAAAAAGNGGDPLQEALEEFGVPHNLAGAFQSGIAGGGVLLWLRTADDQAGAAANILRQQHAQGVGSYAGS